VIHADDSTILSILRATARPDVAQRIARAATGATVVLARVWLTTDGGLHLAASVGSPTGGGTYSRLDGTFSRIDLGEGKIGRIAATRTSFVVTNLRGDEEWLANPGWIARQGVRAFVGHAMTVNDDVFGVLAIFDRARPSAETLALWEFLAQLAATRLAQIRDHDALVARVAALESSPAADRAPTESTSARRVEPVAIMSRSDLRTLERETLEAALAKTAGRVFGPGGAATLLGMKPTTLASRMKALGIAPARAIRRALKNPTDLQD
jgi:transcriptional regulator with GAF, ATPase, and Fis domain